MRWWRRLAPLLVVDMAGGGNVQDDSKGRSDSIAVFRILQSYLHFWLDPVFLTLGDFSLKAGHGKEAREDILGCHR